MTGQDFQMKLDAIVEDLQTRGKGQAVEILLRRSDKSSIILPLSSDAQGVVNAAQLAAVQSFIDPLKSVAANYAVEYEPVQGALDAFKTAQAPHQALIAAATNARRALSDALEADMTYQAAKTALETARSTQAYVAARADYLNYNVSENFGNLGDAKGKYVVG